MASRFRRLVAYRLAADLADELHASVSAWPERERASIGDQLIRAIDSVGANIAEATGRWTLADKRRLLLIARGSLHETEHWVERAEARGLLPRGTIDRIPEIARTLNGLINHAAPE
jgi:four helix bundle protein